MPKRVFISFKAEDKPKINGLRLLAKNPNYDLEFYDESVRVAIDSQNAEYIKRIIRDKIERSGVILCIINVDTYKSSWVDWELETAIKYGKPIVAMAVKDLDRATLPAAIRNKVPFHAWNPSSLNVYLEEAKIVFE
jgi:hypothetical protein